jgi:hypothetical protein
MHLLRTNIAVAAASLLLASCAGTAPELPPASPLSLSSLPALTGTDVTGTPTEVYTRIARGAVTCWFGASGPLKGRYIYHAEAHPESKGGGAEITIFMRDRSAATTESGDPRSLKAFQVGIRPTGGTPEVGVENFKIDEPLATRMKGDVSRWAGTQEGCGERPVTEGWAAQDPKATKAGKAAKAGPGKADPSKRASRK